MGVIFCDKKAIRPIFSQRYLCLVLFSSFCPPSPSSPLPLFSTSYTTDPTKVTWMGTCPTLIPSRLLHKGTNEDVEKITFTLDADEQSRSCQLCKPWMLPTFPTVGLLKAWRNFMWQGDTTAFTVPAKTHRRNLRSYRNLRHWNRRIQDITFFYKMYIIYLWHWIFNLGDQVF